MNYLIAAIGLVAGNYFHQYYVAEIFNAEIAFERSFFQIWALLVCWLVGLVHRWVQGNI